MNIHATRQACKTTKDSTRSIKKTTPEESQEVAGIALTRNTAQKLNKNNGEFLLHCLRIPLSQPYLPKPIIPRSKTVPPNQIIWFSRICTVPKFYLNKYFICSPSLSLLLFLFLFFFSFSLTGHGVGPL